MNDPQGKERFPKLYTQNINGKEKIWIILITLKSELPFIQGHQKQDVKKLTHWKKIFLILVSPQRISIQNI